MARFLHQFDSFTFRRNRHILLALSWALGLGFGGLTFRYGADQLVSLMPSVLSARLSIVGLASTALLPFLFSAFAVYLSAAPVLTVICFARAFLFAYISCGIYQVFGSYGWLVHWLLMFSDILSIPVLYLYWSRHISGARAFRAGTTGIYLAALVLILYLDSRFAAPLLGELIF